ncbi:hypothetical protein BKA66DRAFT_435147 [Pyrenochaeta sp. MPI-SDFR-AT-0127]|nr:hypothetical protein BKA66DRAFT_435147 [Pyrenochaeta sp. MPI-SDFR-AT-0127]
MTPCFEEKELTEKAAVWIQEWQRSELRSRLSVFLQEHAKKTLERVDKIMCFGLGCFPTQWERSRQRSYTQHLAACTVRDLIAQQQGGAAPQIFAQDPSYCAAGMSYIQSHFNMSILDDPEGFKALDGHTFVLSFAPNVPVRQITLGLTHESNGPAGLFCDRIRSEGLECNGKRCEDGRVCPYTTCEPSPAVWKYKQESYWIEYRDRDEQNYFGEVGVYLKKRA